MMLAPSAPLPQRPVEALEPFRIANQYGLFAVMTHQRYEIEFQGSTEAANLDTDPFRYKPQDLDKAPGSTRPINRASNGISGLRRSARGPNTASWYGRKSAC